MSPEEFRKYAHEAVDWMADYMADPERYPVFPDTRPGELIDLLPAAGPEQGEPMDTILRDFAGEIVPRMTIWNHPGFLAYFAVTASGPGIIGDLLSLAMNSNAMLWKSAPAATELEQVTLSWLRQWMGLPDTFFGEILDTASTSTMHAIAAARENADPECRVLGGSRNLRLYTSEQSHSSVEKGAIVVGVGQRNVRKIAVDDEFRMRPDALRIAIEEDLAAGLNPFCVVATVGTTSTTSVDPVSEIADIAEKYGLWLHVDAAYAGSAAICEEFRAPLKGAERAHSLVMNPHKWLLTPIDCSVLYCSRPDILRQTFSLIPEYLRTAADPRAINLMDYGVALGRRFRALKLWFVMRYYGREGLAEVIRQHVALAREFASWVDSDPRFERVAPVPYSTVCFRYHGSDEDNRRMMAEVNRTREFFLSETVLRGKVTLRLAIGNINTKRGHIARVWELLQVAAGAL